MSSDTIDKVFTMDYDASPHEERIRVQGNEYLLREANGAAACRYRNELLKQVELGPAGKPIRLGAIADVEPLLVSLCLVEVKDDGVLRAVPIQTVKSWSSRICKSLFNRIKEVSDLDEVESDLAKEVKAVFEHPDSPLSMGQLREWLGSFPQNQLSGFRDLIKPTPEELAKNEQNGMGAGFA